MLCAEMAVYTIKLCGSRPSAQFVGFYLTDETVNAIFIDSQPVILQLHLKSGSQIRMNCRRSYLRSLICDA